MVGQDIPIYLFGHIDGHLVLRIELFLLLLFCETVTDVSMSFEPFTCLYAGP